MNRLTMLIGNLLIAKLLVAIIWITAVASQSSPCFAQDAQSQSSIRETPKMSAKNSPKSAPDTPEYTQVQQRLAKGWNTWDVHSVMSHVLLPDGLAIRVGLQHNTTLGGDTFLSDALIGRLTPDAEQVVPGPHAWDGSYTDLQIEWSGHAFRLQSAHDGSDVVLLATPLPSKPVSHLLPTLVISVTYLWNQPGTIENLGQAIRAHNAHHDVSIYCTCRDHAVSLTNSTHPTLPFTPDGMISSVTGPYFATDFNTPVGVSSGRSRTVAEITEIIKRQQSAYQQSIAASGKKGPVMDAIQTTLGWDTIYEPERGRVVSPVSRVWSVGWGGYVIFDWDTFFAASMAGIGDRDLAYADAVETLKEETAQNFVPNYARSGGWKSSDRSEPPVGAITVLGLYQKFRDRWFLEQTYLPLLRWNLWWAEHRDIQGYLTWGSDGQNQAPNLDDKSVGTRLGAILESGLDNSPMYDDSTYNQKTHQLEYADVGLMSMYIADCDALENIATTLNKPADAREIHERAERYRTKLATLWDDKAGIFLNKDLHTGQLNTRLSPTNFYPLLAKAASEQQARRMIEEHLLNTSEFWGQWVIPSIEKSDPAFKDQDYWRGRIWGPMNYLVYLGLRNYDAPKVTQEFAQKSFDLFNLEWTSHRHVHENYNAISGIGDDVRSSDRFYHWGALLGLIQYMQEEHNSAPPAH